jgi:isopentenyl-diphosphate delta-isomerase
MAEFHDKALSAARDVSNEHDALVLVDEQDQGVGYLSKSLCHAGQGILHRAFSLLIFNGRGELLIQQRAAGKRLWPLYWSNSCCSHPRGSETMEAATQRRLREELGISCVLRFLYKFRYQAQFDANGAEHELCSVFVGRTHETPRINTSEISAWRWISPKALQSELSDPTAGQFTPWFRLEWAQIQRDHRQDLHSLQ